jgi:translocator assembly and maintenance protein 41
VYWHKVATAPDLTKVMQSEMADIVKGPATMQGLKGLVSAGLGKSLRYGTEKVGKWWTAKSSQ